MNTPKYLKFYRSQNTAAMAGPLPTSISIDEGAIYQLIGYHKYVEEPGEVILPKPGEKVKTREGYELSFLGVIPSTGTLVFYGIHGAITTRLGDGRTSRYVNEHNADVILPRAPSKRVLKFVPVATED